MKCDLCGRPILADDIHYPLVGRHADCHADTCDRPWPGRERGWGDPALMIRVGPDPDGLDKCRHCGLERVACCCFEPA
jgi:hypothetical protein